MENPEQIIRNLQGACIAGPLQFGENSFTMSQIKSEPRGSPSPYGGSVSTGYGGVSPGYGGVSPGYGGVSPGYGGVSPVYNIAASPSSQHAWTGSVDQACAQLTWLNIPPIGPNPPGPLASRDPIEQATNDLVNLDSGEIEKFVNRVAYDLPDQLPNLVNISLSDDIGPMNTDMSDSLTNFTNRAAEACGLMDVGKLG